jgi:hypothetical protein
LGDSPFGRGVSRHTDAALKREQRRDVDDLTVTAQQHLRARRPAQPEGTREIDGNHVIPIRVRILDRGRAADDSRIVHEDIDRSTRGGRRIVHQPGCCFRSGQIANHGRCPHSRSVGDRFRLLPGIFARGVEDDVGAGVGERAGHCQAEPSRSSRDERGAAVQPKSVCHRKVLRF